MSYFDAAGIGRNIDTYDNDVSRLKTPQKVTHLSENDDDKTAGS